MNYVNRKCKVCDKSFQVMSWVIKQNRGKLCSVTCRREWQKKFVTGSANHKWKGGIHYRSGYKFIKQPKHPFTNAMGFVREHRLIMEKHINRYLKPFEKVHHKDGNKLNNKISNLKLFSSNGKHLKEHSKYKNVKCPCGRPATRIGMCESHSSSWYQHGYTSFKKIK